MRSNLIYKAVVGLITSTIIVGVPLLTMGTHWWSITIIVFFSVLNLVILLAVDADSGHFLDFSVQLVIVAVLMAFLLPAVKKVREAARKELSRAATESDQVLLRLSALSQGARLCGLRHVISQSLCSSEADRS